MKWELIDARTGEKVIKIINDNNVTLYLNSKYDPVKEAKRWVDSIDVKLIPSRFLVIGMAAGYHIRELQLEFPEAKIDVLEFNNDYARWIENSKVLEKSGVDMSSINYYSTECMNEIEKILIPFVEQEGFYLLIHKPSLNLIPNKLLKIKEMLNHIVLLRQNSIAREELLARNIKENLKLEDKGISAWINKWEGQPVILVSAGPSLTKQLPRLRGIYERNKNIKIACVGTALLPLLKASIKPSLVMISDPTIKIKEQFNGIKNLDVPLFYLATANYETVSSYKGERYIIWQKGYTASEDQAGKRDELLIRTGGSVATCLLDLLVNLGSKPIALVGQDLAYTNGYSHAEGTHNRNTITEDRNSNNQIVNFYQNEFINTSVSLNFFRKWFENYVSNNFSDTNRFWNCTEGGAYIKGWKHSSLKEFQEHVKDKY